VSFSLKYLFVVIALAAIFTAAIVYRTPFWTVASVNVTVTVLFVGTIGLWFQRLNRTFWIPFCMVGWFYLAFALMPLGMHRLNAFLPGTQITHMINRAELTVRHQTSTAAQEWRSGILNLFDILNSCWALIAGGLAGIIAVLLLRPKQQA
jgi:hypothetical protein